MSTTTSIWIITAMLWFQGTEAPRSSEYSEQSFNTKKECIDYLFWNKGDLVEKLYSVHVEDEQGNNIKTWAFFCENRFISVEEV